MLFKYIYPLKLREKISGKFNQIFKPTLIGKSIQLEFDKSILLDLNPYDVGHQNIILNGFYEYELTRLINNLATNGGIMLDVGANFGYFSTLWANKNPNNKVHAFEASPLNLAPLENNIKKNNLSNRIILNPFAAGNENGTIKFNLAIEQNQTGWGGISIDNSSNLVEVKVITLDKYCSENDISEIEVLKIDTEGADTWVIYGAENMIKNKAIKNVFWEENLPRMGNLGIKTNEAHDFLKKYNYTINKISEGEFHANA